MQDKDLERSQEVNLDLLHLVALKENSITGISLRDYLSLVLLCLTSLLTASLKLISLTSTLATSQNLNSEPDMPPSFGATNVRRAYDFLTGDGIVDRSGGAL